MSAESHGEPSLRTTRIIACRNEIKRTIHDTFLAGTAWTYCIDVRDDGASERALRNVASPRSHTLWHPAARHASALCAGDRARRMGRRNRAWLSEHLGAEPGGRAVLDLARAARTP